MSLMTIAVDLLSASENLGGSPPEFRSYIEKIEPYAFAGISGLDLTTISAGEFTTVNEGLDEKEVPAEALAYLEKIKQAIITPEP